MKVLVTGGFGFIGWHISQEFSSRGDDVAAISRNPPPNAGIGIKAIRGDISHLSDVIGALKDSGAELIVHSAALLTSESQRNPALSFEVNVKGTLNVLEAARLMDLHRVIFISSTAVYGITKEGELVGEDYPKNPVTLYGAQKLFGEHLGENYRINYGLSFIALRLPIVYGPGQSQRGFSAFKEIVEKPLLGERAVVKIGGDQKYDAVYVKDVARSVWLASRAKDPRHSAFNIGAGIQCTLWDLAEIVKSYIPNALIEIGPGFDIAEPIRGPLDLRRAKDELGYVPTYDLERGVRDYIEKISGKRIG
ncbi:MAG: NAD(P)-dependent oxidoreductase [Candidatus Bathyarchaeia archaeon]